MIADTTIEANCTGCNKVPTFKDKPICYVDADGQPQVGTYSQTATESGCEVEEVIFKDSEGEVIEEPTEWKDSGCPNGCIQAIPTKQCNTKEAAEALVEVTSDTPINVTVVGSGESDCSDFQVVRAYDSKGNCITAYICKPSREWQDQKGNVLDPSEWSLCPPQPQVYTYVECFMGFDQYLTEKDIITGSASGEMMKFDITYNGNTDTLMIDYAATTDDTFKSSWYKTLVDYLNGLDGITFTLQSDVKNMEDSFSPIWMLTYEGSDPANLEINKGGGASVFSWYFDGAGNIEHKTSWSGDADEGTDSAPWRACKP